MDENRDAAERSYTGRLWQEKQVSLNRDENFHLSKIFGNKMCQALSKQLEIEGIGTV